MSDERKCPSCGGVLPVSAPMGLCVRCLLRVGMARKVAPPEDKPTKSSDSTAGGKAGEHVGPYKLLEQIGEGGMGVVWMAEQSLPIRRRVALKIIKLGMDTRQVIARFEAERQALALMDHPNIAKVLDAGATDTGRPFFVMELVRGVRITEYCDQNKLSTDDRLKLFTQVCHAIQHAHQKGIIHRDIKPSNILVTSQDGVPVPKVIDFGIAKATDQQLTDKTLFTAFEQFIGTPAYMSPEQAEMSAMAVDTRSDIYSLGVLLYELLTGRTPFDTKKLLAAGVDEIRRIIREEEPPRPSTRMTTLSPDEQMLIAKQRHSDPTKLLGAIRGDLEWIVMKALEKDRNRRYETANGFAADLNRLLANEPVAARPPSNFYHLQKAVRRNKAAFAAIGAVAASLVIGLGLATWQFVQEREARRVAEAAKQSEGRQRAAAEAAQSNAQEARARAEASALQARAEAARVRRYAYAADIGAVARALEEGNLGKARELLVGQRPANGEEDLRGFEWRYFWAISQGDQLRTLYGHAGPIKAVACSPDGRWLASGSSDATVRLWSLDDFKCVAILTNHTSEVVSLAFSPAGRLLVTTSVGGSVNYWEVPSWRLLRQGKAASARVAFSGTGDILALATPSNEWGDHGGDVVLINPATGDTIRTLRRAGNRLALTPDGKRLASANWDKTIRLWDTTTGKSLATVTNEKNVLDLSFAPDAQTLAWSTINGELKLWDMTTNAPKILFDSEDWLTALAFSPDGRQLAVCESPNNSIRLWNLETNGEAARFRGHGKGPRALAFAPNGNTLFTGSYDESIMAWDVQPKISQHGITNAVIDLNKWFGHPVFSTNGKTLAIGTKAGIDLFDMATFRTVAQIKTAEYPVAFEPDGQQLLARNSPFDKLTTINLASLTPIGESRLGDVGKYSCAALSRDHVIVAIGYGSGRISLIDRSTGMTLGELRDASGEIRSLDFSPDGTLLAAGTIDRKVHLWNVASRALLWTGAEHKDVVTSVGFSPDGSLVASASWDYTIRVWNSATGLQATLLAGHKKGVLRAIFSPDGRTLVSTGDDHTLRFWNLATARELAAFRQVHRPIFLAFSSEATTLATGGIDGTVQFWRAPSLGDIEAIERSKVSEGGR